MNKLYIKAPIVLGSICVVSAGLLGGANLLAKEYQKAHPVIGATKEIKALDPDASYTKVETFEPYKKSGIIVQDAYQMAKNGNDKFGFAFTVDAGTPMSEPLAFTVAFSGEISEATIDTVKPYAINITSKGSYTSKAGLYADAVVSGAVEFDGSDESFKVGVGGTVSTKGLYKALTVARESYLAVYTGAGAGPVDDTLVAIQEIFGTAESYTANDISIDFTYKDAAKKTKKGNISKRYDVVLADESVAAVYYAETAETLYSSYSEETGKLDFMVGFQGAVVEGAQADIRPAGYTVMANSFTYTQWEEVANGLVDGSFGYSDAISNGATITSNAFRSAVIKMRDDYYTRTLAAQKANIGNAFPGIFGDDFDAYAEDESFTAVEADLTTETGSYLIDGCYGITLKSGAEAVAYRGTANCTIDQGPVSSTVVVGFVKDGTNVIIKGFSILAEKNFSADEYLGGVVAGEKDIDNVDSVQTNATHTSKMTREMLVAMRDQAKAYFGIGE